MWELVYKIEGFYPLKILLLLRMVARASSLFFFSNNLQPVSLATHNSLARSYYLLPALRLTIQQNNTESISQSWEIHPLHLRRRRKPPRAHKKLGSNRERKSAAAVPRRRRREMHAFYRMERKTRIANG